MFLISIHRSELGLGARKTLSIFVEAVTPINRIMGQPSEDGGVMSSHMMT